MGSGSPFAHAVTWVALLSVFGFGIVMALIGAIKLKLAQKLSLNDAQVGKLISALLFTSLIMVLVSGPFLDKFGHRLTILLGFVITCIAILIIGNAKTYGSAILGCIILGIGGKRAEHRRQYPDRSRDQSRQSGGGEQLRQRLLRPRGLPHADPGRACAEETAPRAGSDPDRSCADPGDRARRAGDLSPDQQRLRGLAVLRAADQHGGVGRGAGVAVLHRP